MKQLAGFMVPQADKYFTEEMLTGGFETEHLRTALNYVNDWSIAIDGRSEERRVGKECRSRWSR